MEKNWKKELAVDMAFLKSAVFVDCVVGFAVDQKHLLSGFVKWCRHVLTSSTTKNDALQCTHKNTKNYKTQKLK